MTSIRLAGALLPAGAVLLGLYGLHNAWVAVLGYHFGIVAFALMLRGRSLAPAGSSTTTGSPEPPPASPLARKVLRTLPMSMMLCAASGAAFYLLWTWIVQPGETLTLWLHERGMSGWSWWLFVPYYGLLHPVLEEWHWSRLGAGASARPGLVDVLFAGYHLLVLATLVRWPWLILIFFVLVGSSVFWRWMYRARETRLVPLLTHGVADLSIVVAASLLILADR